MFGGFPGVSFREPPSIGSRPLLLGPFPTTPNTSCVSYQRRVSAANSVFCLSRKVGWCPARTNYKTPVRELPRASSAFLGFLLRDKVLWQIPPETEFTILSWWSHIREDLNNPNPESKLVPYLPIPHENMDSWIHTTNFSIPSFPSEAHSPISSNNICQGNHQFLTPFHTQLVYTHLRLWAMVTMAEMPDLEKLEQKPSCMDFIPNLEFEGKREFVARKLTTGFPSANDLLSILNGFNQLNYD